MFYSQYSQDEFLEKYIFLGFKNGIFFDIGAYDGKTISNTLFFEKERNWSGICVEPNPNVFKKLKENRKCECLQICIAAEAGLVDFNAISGYSEMLSGIENKYDQRHKQRILKEVKSYDLQQKKYQVEAKQFNQIFFDYGLKEIHYLSIDTEGGEDEILRTIDYSNCFIHVISVENNYNTKDFDNILLNNDFRKLIKLGCDEIYINRKSTFLLNIQ